jgi:hypothetical protein
MFNLRFRKEEAPSKLDPVIDALVSEMKQGWTTEDFRNQAQALKLLMEAKAAEPKPDRVSASQLAAIGANLGGIALILLFEQKNVITTKSLNFLHKPKI